MTYNEVFKGVKKKLSKPKVAWQVSTPNGFIWKGVMSACKGTRIGVRNIVL
jgi:hypothetical protein